MEGKKADSQITVPPSTVNKSAMPVVVDGFQLEEEKETNLTQIEPVKIEIPMPGLQLIFNKEVHFLRRIFWVCVVLAVIISSTIHVANHVKEYMYTETHQHSVQDFAFDLPFPIVTLCSENMFSVSLIKKLKLEKAVEEDAITGTNIRARRFRSTCYNVNQLPSSCWDLSDLIGYNGMNVKDIWDAVAQKPDDIIAECWFGKNSTCKQVGFWKPFYTYIGQCHSFYLSAYNHKVDFPGKFNNLYVVLNEWEDELFGGKSGWKIFIHDWVDLPFSFANDIHRKGFTLDLGYSKEIRIQYKHVEKLNTLRQPCIEQEHSKVYNEDVWESAWLGRPTNDLVAQSQSMCIQECFTETASNIMTCRLPFINNEELEYCTTPESYMQNLEVFNNLFIFNQWLTDHCSNCMPLCHKHDYYAEETNEVKESNERVSTFRVFFKDFNYEDIKEHISKTGYDLFSDIGGSLGLLLGFSVLTLIEIVDAAFYSCLKCIFLKFKQNV